LLGLWVAEIAKLRAHGVLIKPPRIVVDIDKEKWRIKWQQIDWEENDCWNLAKRIEGQQPIAHCGHGT
jgi:hypothetical protein